MSGRYILVGHEPVLEPDLDKWAAWIEKAERHVGDTMIGDSRVSTVFLGLDHSFGNGSPVLWETMIFGGPLDQEQERCGGGWKDAEAMHQRWVKRVTEENEKGES